MAGPETEKQIPTTFRELMELEQVAADFFLAQSPDYAWGRLYGGQVVAQALRAAYATVEAPQRVHSLHAYFVRGGVTKQDVLLEVDRLRDGKSFSTRRVVAHQAGGAILNLDASFQRDETDADVQAHELPADIARPENVPVYEWSTGLAEVREPPRRAGGGRSWVWMKLSDDLGPVDGPDAALHDCALAYLSDHNAIDAIVTSHPSGADWENMMTASLDHSIWFHRRVDTTSWMLFDMRAQGLVNARGLALGQVHALDVGIHIATVMQEGLVRSPRPRNV